MAARLHRLDEGGYQPPRVLLAGERLTTSVLPGLDLAVADILGPWD